MSGFALLLSPKLRKVPNVSELIYLIHEKAPRWRIKKRAHWLGALRKCRINLTLVSAVLVPVLVPVLVQALALAFYTNAGNTSS